MKSFWWLMVLATLGMHSASAESMEDTRANRRAVAILYFQAVPMESTMQDVITELAATLPESEREGFVDIMTNTIRWDEVERASLESMVRHFTVAELQALSAFQGSDVGRSIMKKFGAYMADVMPALQQEIVRTLEEVAAKSE